MPKRISAADATPVKVVVITLDSHLSGAADRARAELVKDLPGLELCLHAASDWAHDQQALERCHDDIETGDIVFANMLFMEDHIEAVLPQLEARRDHCDAMVGCVASGEIIRLTQMGRFAMDGEQSGAMTLLKRLRGKKTNTNASAGAQQMAALRRLPQILRFIPGTAQDVRAYFLTMQYWLAGSDDNIVNLVRFLIDRYATGPRSTLRGALKSKPPIHYPEVGVYHPRLKTRMAETSDKLPKASKKPVGTVGVLVMRSYVLGGDTAHYDKVIEDLEAKGLNVIPAFASGLDARPAVEEFFVKDGEPIIDAMVSLTGFSLVGGPAYNDSKAAEDMLAALDVPCIAAHAVEFQTLDQWHGSERGLMPIEATMMVAIPELDGAVGPTVFGGRTGVPGEARKMLPDPERTESLAARVEKIVTLRRAPASERRLAVVLFNFPPNAGATGTAAHLSVFESLHRTLQGLAADGYQVDVPETVDDLRDRVLRGNAQRMGTDANVHARIATDDHVRREPWLEQIEEQWGPAPGRQQTDGSSIFVLGAQFGNVFVGVQPGFGYEGDPMRLLFSGSFAPTHAFAAFYRYLREDFAANAVLHFGTHGALEFMPGKQAGLASECWPERLIGDLPNFYLYAANNPSEATIAKRRSNATLISYLTPSVTQAGLYRGLSDLKGSLDRWRTLAPEAEHERASLAELIQAQAAEVDLAPAEPVWNGDASVRIDGLSAAIHELEKTLIPHGMHIVGKPPEAEERTDTLLAMAEADSGARPPRAAVEAIVDGQTPEQAVALAGKHADVEALARLADANRLMSEDHEIPGMLQALKGGYVRPVSGGDLLRTPAIMPTGRNIHGFDPFRIPSTFAVLDGKQQTERLLERHMAEDGTLPESVAFVLWGTDNLKSEGGPIGQVLALIGARPHIDSYGRVSGATLIPLEELGRPRIDVVVTLSGIFRDLLPLQTKMLAEATFLAASADEPVEQNYVRKHALAYQQVHDCDLETAALRVFSNADGAYGANVNQLVDSGAWDDEDELAETYSQRKCFAYGRSGQVEKQQDLLQTMLGDVDLAYQNLESVEVGVTSLDHYFDTLGGISRAVKTAKGDAVPVYIGDQTHGDGLVRTLGEQVALETRTRMLNPKWYEGMLKHGHEAVRQIEAHITNTMGWSATTGAVDPWVYQRLSETYVLDDEMRERLAKLNPAASVKLANRLLEAHERDYWAPSEETLEALRSAGDELEDRLEGVGVGVAA
ncbi:MAG: magnesium chelatase subunit H [Alphaproteobacteria bacterium]